MTLRADDTATEFREIDRFDGGVGWIAHPEEAMQRASHALVFDDELWIVDPVDAAGIDDLFAEFGPVAGVVVTLDRHTRDAAAVADRHDAPVYLPDWFTGVSPDLEAPVVRYGAQLADTGVEAYALANNRFWQETILYDAEGGTLVVPEAVGTADFFLAGGERLGVHPALRAIPPRDELGGFDPERVLVGHGAGIHRGASRALRDALAGARKRMPQLIAKSLWRAAPF